MTERADRSDGAHASLPIGAAGQRTDGIDASLIRWFLSLTPAQRLQVLQNTANAVSRLRERRAAD